MNVVVTDKKVDYSGFLQLSTLKDVVSTRGSIDFLVYNRSNESSEELVTSFNSIKDRVKTIIYIADEKNTDMVIKMLVIGFGGHYFDDEFFLENSNELSNLVNSLHEVTEIAEMGGVSVLGDFLNRYLKNGSTSFTKRYLISVKEAVQVLVEEYNKKNVELLQMSETATELFSNTTEVLAGMRREHGELQKAVMRLEEQVKKGNAPSSKQESDGKRMPSLLFFPQISYMKDKKIIRVKEIGSVRYLFSFMLGFRIYMENIKNVRPKLIVVEPIGDLIETRYSDWVWVTQRHIKEKRLYYNDVVFTNCPNKEVLYNMLDDTDYDTFIVLDRSYNSKNHILNSRGNLYYAVGSKSLISKFSLNSRNCFTSCTDIKGTMFTIPTWGDYPSEKAFRERKYMSDMGSGYSMLY